MKNYENNCQMHNNLFWFLISYQKWKFISCDNTNVSHRKTTDECDNLSPIYLKITISVTLTIKRKTIKLPLKNCCLRFKSLQAPIFLFLFHLNFSSFNFTIKIPASLNTFIFIAISSCLKKIIQQNKERKAKTKR